MRIVRIFEARRVLDSAQWSQLTVREGFDAHVNALSSVLNAENTSKKLRDRSFLTRPFKKERQTRLVDVTSNTSH